MKYALTNMYILSGHADMTPVGGKCVLIDKEMIVDIVDAVPEGYDVVDLKGKYVLPGLINMHVHTPTSGKPSKKKMDYAKVAKLLKLAPVRLVMRKLCESNVRQQLLSGVTTVRTVGGLFDFDSRIRDDINAGKLVGPRILAANYAVSVPGGHMTGSVALPVHSAEEAAQMVRDLSETKPDLIKLMITGGVLDAEVPGEPGVLKMPEEYVRAAVNEAHKLGYPVAAHVESTEGMLVALRSGVDTLEHGGKPTQEVLDLFREKGAVLIETLSPALPFAKLPQEVTGWPDMDILNGTALFDNMRACVRACLEAGIPVGLGADTGCPYTTHYNFWQELLCMCTYAGVSPAFAIHSATEVNARIAGIDTITGTVEAGKSADLMIVEGNPLEDITVLRQAAAVIFRGKMIREPKPKRIAVVDRALTNQWRYLY